MAERPVECSQCKKAAKILYKEIEADQMHVTEMCADCPLLLKKLHGTAPHEGGTQPPSGATGLVCGHCQTPLEAIKMGNPMGCQQCYTVFEDILVGELIAEDKLPKQMETVRRNQPLHVGKTPDKPTEIPASNRLTTLNEALNTALQQENYEEAAYLRDQIKALMEKKDEPES